MVDLNAPGPGPDIQAGVAAYRRALIRQRRLRYGLLAALGLALLWSGAALLRYLDLAFPALLPLALGLSGVGLVGAFAAERLRRPSPAATAAMLDRRLDDLQRVTTALELLDAPARTPLAARQLATTAEVLAAADPRRVYPPRPPWASAWLSAALLCLAVGLVLLKDTQGAAAPLPAGLLPPEPTLPAGAAINPTAGPDLTQNLAQQVADSNQAQSALDRLADALDELSVTHQAAVSLRQQAYDRAAQQVRDVGQQSDQLSPEARAGLAQALRGAATDSAAVPALQKAERDAAAALQAGDYRTMAGALYRLAQAIQDTAHRVISQEALRNAYPTPDVAATAAAGITDENAGPESLTPGANSPRSAVNPGGDSPLTSGGTPGASSAGGTPPPTFGAVSRDERAAREAADAEQTGTPGVPGQVHSPDLRADDTPPGDAPQQDVANSGTASNAPSRITAPADTRELNATGNPFDLDQNPASGQSRPGEPDSPPALTMEGTGQAGGPTGTVRGSGESPPGESNRPPLDRRQVVQNYFDPSQR